METQDQKQSPNQTATTKTDKETKQCNTTDLLNPMSGYDQHTNPNLPNTATIPKVSPLRQ